MIKKSSCSFYSRYPESVLTNGFPDALEKFFDILCHVYSGNKDYDWYRNRGCYKYYVNQKFILVRIDSCAEWKILRETGDLYGWRGRGGPYGNIFNIVAAHKCGFKIKWDGHTSIIIEREECGACGGIDFVSKTAVGFRCRNCRGSDSRHIATVRRLGGTPNVDGKPLKNYLIDS